MRVESERARPPGEADLDSEREVDLARYGWAILSRWWLVLAAIALGAVIGWLVSVGGGDVYQARATVYPGQPLTPSSNSQIQSLQTNPSTINQIVKSESVVRSGWRNQKTVQESVSDQKRRADQCDGHRGHDSRLHHALTTIPPNSA